MASDYNAWKKLIVLQWHNAASMRVSFLVQVFSMVVNNGGVAIMWVIFISVFGSVNGWGVADVLASQGIVSLTFGIAFCVCHGAVTFPNDIRSGAFDSYFLRPLHMLPLVWRSYFHESTFGDLLFGVVMIIIACVLSGAPITTFALALLLAIPGAMIMLALSTLINSYSFWRPDDRFISDMVWRVFMTPTMYPAGAFPNGMRLVYTFIIPSLLVAGIPWEAARDHSLLIIALVWLAAFLWLGLAALVFHAGLKRYESGGGVG